MCSLTARMVYIQHADQTSMENSVTRQLIDDIGGRNRHYTATKNISRVLSKLNGKSNQVYHLKFLSGFWTVPTTGRHYEYPSSKGQCQIYNSFRERKIAKVSRWSVSVQGSIHAIHRL